MERKLEKHDQVPLDALSSDVNPFLRHRALVLVVFVVATALLSFQLKNIRLTEDPLGSMYPDGHAFVPVLQAIHEMSPEPRMLVAIVEVKSGDIYNPETIHKIDRITKALMGIEGVLPGGITSMTRGMDHYENTGEGLAIEPILGRRWPQTDEDFKRLKRRIAVNPMGLGRYVSYSGNATMITASLVGVDEKARTSYEQFSDQERADLSFGRHSHRVKTTFQEDLLRGIEEIETKERDANHNLYFLGPQLLEAQMTLMGQRHVPVAAAAMFVIVAVQLVVYFRSLYGLLVPVLTLVLSLVWCMGMLGASGIEFNPMALTFPVMLGLFCLAYSVWAVKLVDLADDPTDDTSRVIRAARRSAPVAASILTAGLAAGSLHAAKVPLMNDLGYLGLFWLVGTSVVVVFIVPILISLFPRPGHGGAEAGQEVCRSIAARLTKLSSGNGRWMMLIMLMVFLVVGGLCGRRLEVGDNVPGSSYIRPGHRWNQCFHLMNQEFIGPYQLLVYGKATQESGLLDPEAIGAVGDFSRYLKSQCGARDSIAFDMMIKTARNMLVDGNPKWHTVPVSREQVKGLAELVVEQGGVESFMDKTFTETTLSPFFPEAETARINEYASRIEAYIDRHPNEKIEFRLGGGLLGMTKAINDGTRDAYKKTLAVAFVLVLVSAILWTGSLLQALIIVLPIAAAQAVVWMIVVATGMKINVPVVLVSAPAVGFGSVFGYSLIQQLSMTASGSGRVQTDGQQVFARTGNVVLFLGGLVFTATLPWFFIGLRFPSQMALVLGTTVAVQAVLSALFLPALASLFKAGSSP